MFVIRTWPMTFNNHLLCFLSFLSHNMYKQWTIPFICLTVWPLIIDSSFTIQLSFYESFLQKSVILSSIHPSFFHPWEYESLPQSHRSLCSSQTSGTSAVSVSDLHSCVEQLRHKLNLSQYPHSLLLLVSLSVSLLPVFLPPSYLPSFPLKGNYLLFTGRRWYFISKSMWLAVVLPLSSLSLSFSTMYWETNTTEGCWNTMGRLTYKRRWHLSGWGLRGAQMRKDIAHFQPQIALLSSLTLA